MRMSARNGAGRWQSSAVSASVRAASASPQSSAASDLSLLRAAPSRSTGGTAQAGPVRQQGDTGSTDDAAVSGSDSPVGSGSASPATAKPSDTAAATSPSRSAFGETLAASMTGTSAAPKSATPARGTRTKTTDSESPPAPALLPALSLPAATAATPAKAQTPATNGSANRVIGAASNEASTTAKTADTVESDATTPSAPTRPAAATTATAAAAVDTDADTEITEPASQEPGAAAPGSPDLSFAAATFASFKTSPQPLAGKADSDEPIEPAAGDSASSSASSPAASSGAAASASATPVLATHPALLQLTTAAARGEGNPPDAESGFSGSAAVDSGTTATAINAAGTAATSGTASAAPSTPATAASVSVPVHAEVGTAAWGQELGVRLNWMAQAGISSASLHLTPEQLGPVEVRISVHQNQASVWFGAAQPDTRSALEQALPKLKEMFASQGMNLAHTGVSDQSASGAQRERQSQPALSQAAALRGLNATPVTSAARVQQGLVDTYA